MTDKTEYHIDVLEHSTDAINLLAQASGLGKQVLKDAMQKGAIWHSHGKQTNRIRRAKNHCKRAINCIFITINTYSMNKSHLQSCYLMKLTTVYGTSLTACAARGQSGATTPPLIVLLS
ncbi:hypothetical protein PEC18_00375 [Paucibacter sp. O1-1]|nr:hypothetical protein [Paucibacter sp. O1-1]MDA3824370.1 hypothetical protein [Paucibacter sp. O1-1]